MKGVNEGSQFRKSVTGNSEGRTEPAEKQKIDETVENNSRETCPPLLAEGFGES